MVALEKLLEKVLKKIVPSKKELELEEKISKQLVEKIKKTEGKHVDAIIAGSIARNTHLRNDRDIDIFVMFPKHLGRIEFEKQGLKIGKAVFRGHNWEKAYSEHPYIRGTIKGFAVEIVPSYKVKSPMELKSSVDRTPFHNKYLLERLSEQHRKEIRLLKQFLKGINCYGADLKTNSFPGYVAELLVLKYGSFSKVLENASNWKIGTVIDLEHELSDDEARKKFNHHLIVVDPVDESRNVSAALSLEQFNRFVAACNAFLKKPSVQFFFPKKTKPLNIARLRLKLNEMDLVCIKMPYPKKALSDIIYGQIRKLNRKIFQEFKLNEFLAERSSQWSDEEKNIALLIELECLELEKVQKRIGPLATDLINRDRFIESNKKSIVSGPRIESNHWVIEIKRKYWNANLLLKDFLKKEKAIEKKPIKNSIPKAKILSQKELERFFKQNNGFAQFLTKFLKGKEEFLEY